MPDANVREGPDAQAAGSHRTAHSPVLCSAYYLAASPQAWRGTGADHREPDPLPLLQQQYPDNASQAGTQGGAPSKRCFGNKKTGNAGGAEMSRGRPPRMACKEACASAAQRGVVLDATALEKSRIDFILFSGQRVCFVRVKRSHSRICSPKEIAIRFWSEIAMLRTIPLTPVVSREIWVFLPWRTWQYFCIGDDTITEIYEDTGKISGIVQGFVRVDTEKSAGTQQNAVTVPDQHNPLPAGAGTEGASPWPGSLYPDVIRSKV
jgi:hypothetical protein